jgi:hypothetical protein
VGADDRDPTYNVQGIDLPLSVIPTLLPVASAGHVPCAVGRCDGVLPVLLPPELELLPPLEPELA